MILTHILMLEINIRLSLMAESNIHDVMMWVQLLQGGLGVHFKVG